MKVSLIIVLVALSSCGKFRIFKKSSQEKQNISKIYASGKLTVAVFYEEGAEPFTDIVTTAPGIPSVKLWDILEVNLKAMFPGKTITVPKDLAQMAKLSDQNQASWTNTELHSFGMAHGQTSLGDTTVFNVFFLKGFAESATSVIGLHLSGTKTIAIFKEVVVASAPSIAEAATQRYVEQATLVHEIGHAVGLVNNGLPMTSSHEDTGHRAHCHNPDCVMYWKNEGTNDLTTYITNHLLKLNPIMLDSACLSDVTSYQ
jgi:predicted Zn-dependent protease